MKKQGVIAGLVVLAAVMAAGCGGAGKKETTASGTAAIEAVTE